MCIKNDFELMKIRSILGISMSWMKKNDKNIKFLSFYEKRVYS